VGLVCSTLPILGFFAARGALDALWTGYLKTNLLYVQQVGLGQLLRSAVEFAETHVLSLGLLWVGTAAGLALLWGGRHARHRQVLATVWLLTSALGIVAGRRFFSHYLVQSLAPGAVLAGGAVPALVALLRSDRRDTRLATGGLLVGLLVVTAGIPVMARLYNAAHGWRVIRQDDRFVANEVRTARYLKARTTPADTLLVVGMNAQLCLQTGLRPASRFIDALHLDVHAQRDAGRTGAARKDDVLGLWEEDMRRNRPKYVVLSNYARALDRPTRFPHHEPRFGEWLARNYTYETTLRGGADAPTCYNVIYRRTGP
jgi:hypothetical protein